MRARRTLTLLAVVGLIAAPASARSSVQRSTQHPSIAHNGRWFTDSRGRVVILHGVNMVMKVPPYQPSAMGFGDDDAAVLQHEGFNTVPLGLILKGLEPQPGVFNDAYLNAYLATVRTLGAHGLRVLVDFHQVMFNERFNGEGMPDWMVQDDGIPAIPDQGFPVNYFAMPALWRAFDHLWANDRDARGIGLQDEFASAWRHVAAV